MSVKILTVIVLIIMNHGFSGIKEEEFEQFCGNILH